jgi:hypothetical protein
MVVEEGVGMRLREGEDIPQKQEVVGMRGEEEPRKEGGAIRLNLEGATTMDAAEEGIIPHRVHHNKTILRKGSNKNTIPNNLAANLEEEACRPRIEVEELQEDHCLDDRRAMEWRAIGGVMIRGCRTRGYLVDQPDNLDQEDQGEEGDRRRWRGRAIRILVVSIFFFVVEIEGRRPRQWPQRHLLLFSLYGAKPPNPRARCAR